VREFSKYLCGMKQKSLTILILSSILSLVLNLSTPVQAATNIDLYNTGMTTPWYSGAPTPFADGITDTHWTILSMPSGSPANAITASANAAWLANNTTSKWINDSGNGSGTSPFGTYVYRTTFTLAGGTNLNTVGINFRISQDNTFTSIKLNGVDTGLTNPATFNAWSNNLALTSGFQTGTNTLDFTFVNAGTTNNPQGLRVEFTGAFVGVPEPGTLALLALGGLALLKRRKH
jgi:PEP-CTERM motif